MPEGRVIMEQVPAVPARLRFLLVRALWFAVLESQSSHVGGRPGKLRVSETPKPVVLEIEPSAGFQAAERPMPALFSTDAGTPIWRKAA